MPIGLSEFLLIVIAVIIFVRPEDLPRFLRNAGRLYGQFQDYCNKLRHYTNETYREISRLDIVDESKHANSDPGGELYDALDGTGEGSPDGPYAESYEDYEDYQDYDEQYAADGEELNDSAPLTVDPMAAEQDAVEPPTPAAATVGDDAPSAAVAEPAAPEAESPSSRRPEPKTSPDGGQSV